MKIRILGTGGFLNEGLPYNSLLVDGHLLLETPPDILPSLGREGVPAAAIREIFISHTHGDHVFGAPLLLFNLWIATPGAPGPRILGPRDLRERILALARLAIRPDHPYVPWIAEACRFETVDASGLAELGGCRAEFFPMFHERETLGLGLSREGRLLFQYLPDSRWDPRLAAYLRRGARLVVCDVNGTGGDRGVHLGLEDLEAERESLLARGGRLLGTHLSRQLEDPGNGIEIARPGMLLELEEG